MHSSCPTCTHVEACSTLAASPQQMHPSCWACHGLEARRDRKAISLSFSMPLLRLQTLTQSTCRDAQQIYETPDGSHAQRRQIDVACTSYGLSRRARPSMVMIHAWSSCMSLLFNSSDCQFWRGHAQSTASVYTHARQARRIATSLATRC